MFIIGEKINSSRSPVRQAILARDEGAIAALAVGQAQAGAHAIDINAGALGVQETECLVWLAQVVGKATVLPMSIDTPNPGALEAVLPLVAKPPIVNSVTAQAKRWEGMIPLIAGRRGTRVIALTLDDGGMPQGVDQRLRLAEHLIQGLTAAGVAEEDIFLDPMVAPLATDDTHGKQALSAIGAIRARFSRVHITCGLSNVSYGLPARSLLNRAFLGCAMAAGLDAAILDPQDGALMAHLAALEALLGQDEYCSQYIGQYRDGKLGH